MTTQSTSAHSLIVNQIEGHKIWEMLYRDELLGEIYPVGRDVWVATLHGLAVTRGAKNFDEALDQLAAVLMMFENISPIATLTYDHP